MAVRDAAEGCPHLSMAIHIDSADLADAEAAAGLGFVAIFTTNSSLIARHGGAPMHRFSEVLDVFAAIGASTSPGS